MKILIEESVLRQALDALERRCGTNAEERNELIPRIRVAIDAAENVEPVAWISSGGDVSRSKKYFDEMGFDSSPLYTHPVPAVPEGIAKDAERYKWLLEHDEITKRMRRYEWLLEQDCEYSAIGRDGVEKAIDKAMLADAPKQENAK